MAKQELKIIISMLKENGEIVPFESLNEEEIEEFRKKGSERCSRALSSYYSKHLDEFEKLQSIR